MDPYQVGLVGFAILAALILVRVPVGVALAFVGVGGLLHLSGPAATSALVGSQVFRTVATWSFTAVPLFLLMGELAFRAGLIGHAYDAARLWLLRMPGGLAMATVAGCALFGATTGSGVAASAAMSRLTVPEMLRRGYDPRLTTGSVASAATIAVLIPPSIILVVYALFTQTSLGLLFLAAYIPALITTVLYLVMVVIAVKLKPSAAPPTDATFALGPALIGILRAWGVILLMLIIAGGIFLGLFTATEAGAIAAIAALGLYVRSGNFSLRGLLAALNDTARMSGMIFLILIGASIFSRFITQSGLARRAVELLVAYDMPVFLFLAILCVAYILMGAFIDSISMMLLTLPVLLPILVSLDISLIWFGIFVVKVVEVGAITPPFGITVYSVKAALGDMVELEDIFRGIWWFLAADVVVIAIIIFFPSVVMFLPDLVGSR